MKAIFRGPSRSDASGPAKRHGTREKIRPIVQVPSSSTGNSTPLYLSSSAAMMANALPYIQGSKNPASYTTNPVFSPPYEPYDIKPGEIWEWNLAIEHQFTKNFAVSAAYVGSHGMNLQFVTDLNQITNPARLAANDISGCNGATPASIGCLLTRIDQALAVLSAAVRSPQSRLSSNNRERRACFAHFGVKGGRNFSAVQTAWRRERDSNPRYGFPYSGFQDRLFQPLTHPSGPVRGY